MPSIWEKGGRHYTNSQQESGYPRHRENRENSQTNSLSGKAQGTGFAQLGNFLFLKVKDVSIFAAKISNFVQVYHVSFV